jgi:hypothetical protein
MTAEISAAGTGYHDTYISWNWRSSADFVVGYGENAEMKFHGLTSKDFGTTGGNARVKWSTYDGPDGYLRWYIKTVDSYPGVFMQTPVTTVNDVIDNSGEWVHMCLRVSNNTGNNADGFVELFIDGVLVATTGAIRLTNNESWHKIQFSTFTGGGSSSQETNMLFDATADTDDLVVWEGGDSWPARGVASESNRDITNSMPTECNINK